MKRLLLFFSFLTLWLSGQSQALKVFPVHPESTDSVRIIYDASQGDQGLMGYQGDVYVHTGLITTESSDGHDWKHVVSNWGENKAKTLMKRIGTDLYQIDFRIDDFYQFDPSQEKVLKMAFVFRSADASLTGRAANGSDIFYSINIQTAGNYRTHTLKNGKTTIYTDEGVLTIRAWADNVFKISFLPSDTSMPDTSYVVVSKPKTVACQLESYNQYLLLSTSQLKIKIEKFPVRLKFIQHGDTVLKENPGIYRQFNIGNAGFQIDDQEAFYGSGSRSLPVNRRGYLLEVYNQAHYGYGKGEPNLNIGIPLVVSSKSYLLFFDNASPGKLNLDNEQNNKLTYETENGTLSYFFIGGDQDDSLLSAYTGISGRQPLPPIWALGYIQSRFGYENTEQAETVVRNMQNFGIPLDAIVLDLYWFGSPSTMGNLMWDYSRFSNPEAMISHFSSLGVKTILITEPYFTKQSLHYSYLDSRKFFALNQQGQTYVLDNFWAGPAALIDFTKKGPFDWMWSYYQSRHAEGVAGWWCDLGEPENHPSDMIHAMGSARKIHNLYPLFWARDLFNKYANTYPNERLFNLSRSGYAGMQRYSTFPWSGDTRRDWESLQGQIPLILGMSMSGVGYMHTDIGGFTGNGQNNELYTRWMQFGAFSPVMRAHGVNVATEPYLYPTEYRNIVKKFIKLRYQLLPYNYNLAWMNHTTGRPLAIPLSYFDHSPAASNISDEYFWGEQLLVAPVTNEGARKRLVYFPAGKWINFWNNQTLEGNQQYNIDAPLDEIPLFVKAGSFIPMAKPIQSSDFYRGDSLMVWYYPDVSVDSSTYTLFMDDGKTKGNWEQGTYQLIHFKGMTKDHSMEINLSASGNGFEVMPTKRELHFEIKRVGKKPSDVTLSGLNLPLADSYNAYLEVDKAAFWDAAENTLKIHFPFTGENLQLWVGNAALGYSEIINQSPSFSLGNPYPIPFQNNLIIPVHVKNVGRYQLQIVDIMGNVIYERSQQAKPGRFNFRWVIDKGNKLAAGIYLAIISDASGRKAFKKLVKQ
jgi:oligosaccharide 4-alpha-D-glucosyltransferase